MPKREGKPVKSVLYAAFVACAIHCLAIIPCYLLISRLIVPGPSNRMNPIFLETLEKDPIKRANIPREPLKFDLIASPGSINHHEMRLNTSVADQLLALDSIGVTIATYEQKVDLVSAELEVVDKKSNLVITAFKTDKDSIISDNRMLRFRRVSSSSLRIPANEQEVIIKIQSRGSKTLAIWGFVDGNKPRSPYLWKAISRDDKAMFVSFEGGVENGKYSIPAKRFELLAYLWGIDSAKAWTLFVPISISLILWVTAASIMLTSSLGRTKIKSGAIALSGACFFLSIALMYATLIPPFQAPDEQNHFLTLFSNRGNSSLEKKMSEFLNTGHFERIKMHVEEHFAGSDISNPLIPPVGSEVKIIDINRSPVTQALWPILGRILPLNNIGFALYSLRLINGLVVAISLFTALCLLGTLIKPEAISIISVGPFLLIPTLFMHCVCVSNYPFLIAGYILQSVVLTALWIAADKPTKTKFFYPLLGSVLAFGVLLASASGDGGVFCTAFWALMIPLWFTIVGTDDEKTEFKSIRQFVAALIGTLLVGKLLALVLFTSGNLLPVKVSGRIMEILNQFRIGKLGAEGFVIFSFITTVAIGLILGIKIRNWISLNKLEISRYNISTIALCFFTLGILIAPAHQIPGIENPLCRISFFQYLERFIYSFFKGFGPGTPATYSTQTFWGGFGWMETQMPWYIVDILRFGVLFGLILLIALNKKHILAKISNLMISNVSALMAYLCLTVYAYHFLGINLHGRYLIAAYLFIIVPSFEGYRRLFAYSSDSITSKITSGAVFSVLCASLHAIVLNELLLRYF